MDSVRYTGTCLRPSCTAMVWPIMSGITVERRDHVLMTFLVPLSFCTSTLLSRWPSTNGPFFRLRGISGYLPLPSSAAATAHDEAVALLVLGARAALLLARRV